MTQSLFLNVWNPENLVECGSTLTEYKYKIAVSYCCVILLSRTVNDRPKAQCYPLSCPFLLSHFISLNHSNSTITAFPVLVSSPGSITSNQTTLCQKKQIGCTKLHSLLPVSLKFLIIHNNTSLCRNGNQEFMSLIQSVNE